MTAKTCENMYNQAKKVGNKEAMAYWKERAAVKGLILEEEKEVKKGKK